MTKLQKNEAGLTAHLRSSSTMKQNTEPISVYNSETIVCKNILA